MPLNRGICHNMGLTHSKMLKPALLCVLFSALFCSAAFNPSYEELLDRYSSAKTRMSDINEHVATLYRYGRESSSILELGVRSAVSSWAFLRALYDRSLLDGHSPGEQSLVGVDLEYDPQIGEVKRVAKALNIPYTFVKGNDLEYSINEPIDTVFIDTWHVYGQLKRELTKFAPYTKKWIILHDTTVDAIHGEVLRSHSNIDAQVKESGFPREEITKGLWPAVEEFLAENSNWLLEQRYTHNNGLTILRHIDDTMIAPKSSGYTVVDISIFNGEVDMLRLRLAELSPLISKFYITESAVTFSGLPKPLIFPTLLDDPIIKALGDRIVYLPIIDSQIKHVTGNWNRERFIREYAAPIVKAAYQSDANVFAISSDLDEVANVDVVKAWLDVNYQDVHNVIRINMDFFYYSLKWRKRSVWISAYLIPVKAITSLDAPRPAMPHELPRDSADRPGHISNAGWHMSYFLSNEQIQNKLKSFSPIDHNIPPFNTAEHIEYCVANGLDLFGRKGQEMDPTPNDAPRPKNVHLLPEHFR